MDFSNERGKDYWSIAAAVLGILVVLVIAGSLLLMLFGGNSRSDPLVGNPQKTELAAVTPGGDGMNVVSEITVVGSDVPDQTQDTDEDKVHRYEIINQRMTWSEAETYCENQGGYLATVTSQEEYDKILALAQSSGRKVLWLGAQRGASGSFEWITGEAFSYTHWLQGEPNNDGGTENCLVMFLVNGEWVWADVPVDVSPYYSENIVGFVCEYEN